MGKVRIYELARELGVENKDILARIKELGIPGKSSHSHSLDDDEADQVRRAIIRQAIGVSPASEVVTTRLNRETGETDTIVESRKGNIIRRRRQAADTQEDEPSVDESVAETVSPDEGVLSAPEGGEEQFQSPEQLATIGAVQPGPGTDAAQAEGVATDGLSAKELFAEVAVGASIVPAAEEPSVGAAPEPKAPEEESEDRKKFKPKVLGKIELPQKRPPRESVRIERPAPVVATGGAAEEDDESDNRRSRRRRSRRREFTKNDLVDYEGRDGRKTGKTARGVRGRALAAEDEEGPTQPELTQPKASKRVVKMDELITVGELAKQMSVKSAEVIANLIEIGVMATINQAIDFDIASLVAEGFGFQLESVKFDETDFFGEADDKADDMVPRPPVVTVMGHVDHGKTSLLDKIRTASVAAREHGGITQHIGAYSVVLEDGRRVSFIDTPGHAAFTSMRARGAKVTDIVVLVVAADDGVMPQTIEAINHAKAAGVSIVVAINKIDKRDANQDRVKQQLTEHGLQPEDWGGETMFYPVSAINGDGVPELLEGICLLAEIKELKANPSRRACGVIIEAKQVLGRGSVATVLVQSGTLRVGDGFVTGAETGRVRSMLDYRGERVVEASPATPVEITGLSGVPEAGDDFFVVESEMQARQIAVNRASKRKAKEEKRASVSRISLEEFAKQANNLAAAELNVILKADVHGSVEAVRAAAEELSTAKVKVRVIHAAVGGVSESDVQLAIASKAIIVGFGVRAEPRAISDAEVAGVEIRFYRIIYELLDDLKKAMLGLLPPVKEERALGRAEVRETFSVPKMGTIAGCYVLDGTIRRGSFVRLVRDSRVVHEGKMGSLRRFKDDVREVQSGYECGVGIESFNDVKSGDIIEFYELKDVAPTLD